MEISWIFSMQVVQILLCTLALLMCCRSESFVGGHPSTGLLFFINRCCRHLFTTDKPLVLSYINITNLSTTFMSSSSDVSMDDCCLKLSVAYGNEFHVDHAVFLPRPANCETVSHPVNAYQKGSASHFSFPRMFA